MSTYPSFFFFCLDCLDYWRTRSHVFNIFSGTFPMLSTLTLSNASVFSRVSHIQVRNTAGYAFYDQMVRYGTSTVRTIFTTLLRECVPVLRRLQRQYFLRSRSPSYVRILFLCENWMSSFFSYPQFEKIFSIFLLRG